MKPEHIVIVLFACILLQNLVNRYHLRRLTMRTYRPLGFKVTLVRKRKGMNTMSLIYNVTASAPVEKDVVERRLLVTVNGETRDSLVFSQDTVSFGELSFEHNDNVSVSLVDVDDVGNVSTPAVLEFVASDTLPPSAPGGLGVSLVREE